MVLGEVEKLSPLEVLKYFSSRPRDSQIGAWVSKQSSRISARGVLEGKFLELKQKFQQGDVPLPSFWGGYRVKFSTMEFWQGANIVFTIVSFISGITTAGKLTDSPPKTALSPSSALAQKASALYAIALNFFLPQLSGKLCTSIGAA